MLAYIQRWTILKNSAEDISYKSAIDFFRRGLQRIDFKEQLGQLKVRTLTQLLEHTNNWADGEDSKHNEADTPTTRGDPDYDYYGGDRGFDRRRKRLRHNFYDDRGPDMVATGFPSDRDGRPRDNNRTPRRENQDEPQHNQKREWRPRLPRDDTCAPRSVQDQLDAPYSPLI